MEYKQILNVAVLAGEIMLRSGAETYRVEDRMKTHSQYSRNRSGRGICDDDRNCCHD